jgi:hypothetical protein
MTGSVFSSARGVRATWMKVLPYLFGDDSG